MDFSAALPTFVVTLREGVEAALVVGIVLACLKKAQQSQLNPWVYGGVGVGIAASVLVGALLSWSIPALEAVNTKYTPAIAPLMEGAFSVAAIAMLSWMLIWMTKQARSLKAEVEGAVSTAMHRSNGAGWGVFGLIFIAVLREGVETALFIAAQFQQGLIPVIGALVGIAGAALIGVLLFRWGVKINIRRFFQVMGVLLLLVVSGLVVSALKHFNSTAAILSQIEPQFADLCFSQPASCILGPQVWDASHILPDKQFPGVVLKALFGYRQQLYLIQAVAYVTFVVTVGSLYFRSLGAGTTPSTRTKPATQTALGSSQD